MFSFVFVRVCVQVGLSLSEFVRVCFCACV